MRKNHFVFAFLLAFACFINQTLAQDEMTALGADETDGKNLSVEERAAKMTKYLGKKLSLNADQEKQVGSVMLERGKKMAEIRNMPKGKDRRQAMMDLRDFVAKQDEQLKIVLSPDQMTQYLQMKEQQKGKMKERFKKG